MKENVRSKKFPGIILCVLFFVGDFLNFILLIFNSTTDTPTFNSPTQQKSKMKRKKENIKKII